MTDRAANPSDLAPLGIHYNTFTYKAKSSQGETIEHVAKPTFWVHLQKKLSAMDELIVFAEDGTWEVKFRVMKSEGGGVVLRQMAKWVDDSDQDYRVPLAEPPIVEFAGPHHKWRIKSGETVHKFGIETKEDALRWVERLFKIEPEKEAA